MSSVIKLLKLTGTHNGLPDDRCVLAYPIRWSIIRKPSYRLP